jgi:hypothetical protein
VLRSARIKGVGGADASLSSCAPSVVHAGIYCAVRYYFLCGALSCAVRIRFAVPARSSSVKALLARGLGVACLQSSVFCSRAWSFRAGVCVDALAV